MKAKLTLCEFAKTTDNGSKYTAVGAGFRVCTLPQYPVTIMQYALIAFEFSVNDRDEEYTMEISVQGEDGENSRAPFRAHIANSFTPGVPEYMAFGLQMKLQKPGHYYCQLKINGKKEDDLFIEAA